MLIPRRKPEGKEDRHEEHDRIAGRGFVALCICYLVLGIISVLMFASTRLPDLYDAREVAVATETALAETAPTGELDLEQVQVLKSAREARAGVQRGWVRIGAMFAALLVVTWFLLVQRRKVTTHGSAVSTATFMIVLVGGLLLAGQVAVEKVLPNFALLGLVDLLLLHLCACICIPWRPQESVPPLALLLLVWAMTFLVPHNSDFDILDRFFASILSPLILAPGAAVAAWRWQRREEEARMESLDQKVKTAGAELSRARIVHDAMFPKPFDTGYVRFEYDYRPIAEIGGDYVHINHCDLSGRIYLTLLDVSGHGLAAALTVNRLFGELERIRAENPDAEPSTVMALLNRYINLTMAAHSMYVTGLCMMLDPRTGDLKWVNAGHPPSLVRKTTGDVFELECTSVLLGVYDSETFDPNQQQRTLDCGDVVIAYTDGVFEARNENKEQFGLHRVREIATFNPPPRDWSKFISNAVENHHGGNADDDVLVASLTLNSLRLGEIRPAPDSSQATSFS